MNWMRVAGTEDFQEDGAIGVAVGDQKIALYREDGEYFATANICTHEYALLSEGYLDEGIIECPLHQAQFDVRTGKVCCGPAEADISAYPVKVEDGSVFVDLSGG